jgi:hypothetical protein
MLVNLPGHRPSVPVTTEGNRTVGTFRTGLCRLAGGRGRDHRAAAGRRCESGPLVSSSGPGAAAAGSDAFIGGSWTARCSEVRRPGSSRAGDQDPRGARLPCCVKSCGP